jgi:hypothetical protein
MPTVPILMFIIITPCVWGVYGVISWVLSIFGVDGLDRVALSFLAALTFIICVSVNAWDERNETPKKALRLRWSKTGTAGKT